MGVGALSVGRTVTEASRSYMYRNMEVDLRAIDMGHDIPNIDSSRRPTVLEHCSALMAR